jgi:hypothetical protein
MQQSMTGKWVLSGALMAALAGCAMTPPVPTKSINANRTGYLEGHFAPADLPAAVLQTIRSADTGTLPFTRIRIEQVGTSKDPTGKIVGTYTHDRLLINEGNGLISELTRISSNGIEVLDEYTIGYRDMFGLRSQAAAMSTLDAGYIVSAVKLDDFTAFTGQDSVHYAGVFTSTQPYAIASKGSMTCKRGASIAASELNPAIPGTAVAYTCEKINANGVETTKFHDYYLQAVGIFITVASQTASNSYSFKFTSFRMS